MKSGAIDNEYLKKYILGLGISANVPKPDVKKEKTKRRIKKKK